MTGSKPDIFHTPLLTPFASRLIHICVDLREIRAADAHPKIPQNPCGRRDTEACTHLRGQPQNPREGRAACTKPEHKIVRKAPESMTPGLFCRSRPHYSKFPGKQGSRFGKTSSLFRNSAVAQAPWGICKAAAALGDLCVSLCPGFGQIGDGSKVPEGLDHRVKGFDTRPVSILTRSRKRWPASTTAGRVFPFPRLLKNFWFF